MTVSVIDSFVSKDVCSFIIDSYKQNLTKIEDRPGFYEDLHIRKPYKFDSTTLDQNNKFYSSSEIVASAVINDLIYISMKKVEEHFEKSFNNFIGGMTRLVEGANQDLHSDMTNLDGTPLENDEEAKILEYSALLYLSDYGTDFTGGQLIFPKQDLEVFPKAGTLVFFKGDQHHPHSVTNVLSGNRYAIVMFFG